MIISNTHQHTKTNNFRVLLVYPNIQKCSMMPYSIGLFTALLKQEGYQVDLFDSTFYMNDLTANYENYQTAVKRFDWAERGIEFKTINMMEDFRKKVETFQPDLITVSVVENTYPIGRAMIRSLSPKLRKIPVLWGGVFATFAPKIILKDDVGDYVCRGEGEYALLEFCRRACSGEDLHTVPNLWSKRDGQIIKNQMGPQVNINELPFADYNLFEEQAIYRPMQGKVWRTIGVESQRGCPYTCTYCNSPSQNIFAKQEQGVRFYRKKTIKRVKEELEYLHKKHNIELIYWLVDTFLAMNDKEFDELVEMYSDFRIPFWMNTRSETITEHRAECLEKMNMLRMNFGIEHGNYDYRLNMLKRRVTNEVMLESFAYTANRSYTVTGNCIIGMPEENRALIFDTIEFCRKLPKSVEFTGAFIFAPYHGTELRRIAEQKGYIDSETICDIQNPTISMLDQPQLQRNEVIGLARTFGLYQVLPKSEWKWIEKAESDTQEGRKIFDKLEKQYHALNAQAKKVQYADV
jgi:radical SAM superfamily enzyme YgiQ (UPF0313 family)